MCEDYKSTVFGSVLAENVYIAWRSFGYRYFCSTRQYCYKLTDSKSDRGTKLRKPRNYNLNTGEVHYQTQKGKKYIRYWTTDWKVIYYLCIFFYIPAPPTANVGPLNKTFNHQLTVPLYPVSIVSQSG